MRIAIIGAGWTGSHLATVLMKDHDIVIYDQEPRLFCGTSQINQNRLHLGYHYARNKVTRQMCRTTFAQFMKDYGSLTTEVKQNLYAVPLAESLLDFGTIDEIFSGNQWHHEQVDAPFLRHTEAVINVQERFISPLKAQVYFEEILASVFCQDQLTIEAVETLQKDCDLVIDCTNNTLLEPLINADYFEAVAMFLYRPKQTLPFDALTYVDGQLFSLYPYEHGLMSLSHVEYSVIRRSMTPIVTNSESIQTVGEAMEKSRNHAKHYWPEFDDFLQPVDAVVSMKSKRLSASACRAPIFRQENNLLSCFTGKIQGIYAIEEKVKTVIANL